MLTTQQVADKLGVTRRHVALLIRRGTIKATPFGRMWLRAD